MSHPEFEYMERQGLVLTEEGEDLYYDWDSIGGCTCFISPPCNYCTHPGHPISLAESPELWESELVAEIRAATKGPSNK